MTDVPDAYIHCDPGTFPRGAVPTSCHPTRSDEGKCRLSASRSAVKDKSQTIQPALLTECFTTSPFSAATVFSNSHHNNRSSWTLTGCGGRILSSDTFAKHLRLEPGEGRAGDDPKCLWARGVGVSLKKVDSRALVPPTATTFRCALAPERWLRGRSPWIFSESTFRGWQSVSLGEL